MLLPLLWLLHGATAAAQPPTRPARPPARQVAMASPAAAPGTILVRAAGGMERPVSVTAERDGAIVREYVRADQLVSALGGALTEDASGRYRLRIAGSTVALRDGVAFAVSGEGPVAEEHSMVNAAFVEGDRLWLPLQLLSDVLPRLSPEFDFDADRRAFAVGRRPTGASITRTVAAREAQPARETAPAADSVPASVRLPSIVGPRRREPAVEPPAASPEEATADAPASEATASGLARRLVVVDAGHGGPDAGMRGPLGGGPRIVEKQITLAVAQSLRSALRERGVGVAMTRTTDTLIALADRGRIANQRKGDLFVSIHVNAANPRWPNPGSTRGFETYFLSEAKTADDRRVADLENESVRFEGPAGDGGAGDPLSFIMRDMAQNEHLRESSELATMVQRRLARAHPGPSRGVRQAGFRVLVSAFMPAVLVEVGFGSNPADAAWMNSAAGQREIADAVADAAVEYLRRYEQRVRAAPRP